MDLLKKPGIKKWILIIGIIIILIIVLGFITKSFWWPKVSCVFPEYKSAGSEVYKSYPDQYLAPEEWKKYQDPEVVFFFTPETQELFSSKISSLKGYGGLSYDNFDKSISIDKGYYGKDCQPTAYHYEMILRGTILGQNLSAYPFGRWYYKDAYKISVVYQPSSQKWTEFDIALTERRLIPGDALNTALEIAKNSAQSKEITDSGYQISEVYWSPKNQYTESTDDTITFVYSKIIDKEKNLASYITIEVDNFSKNIISEKKEEKTVNQL